jgi:plasmid stabilization system protein ParE
MDLVRLYDFLAPEAKLPAKRVVLRLGHAAERLLKHPRMGERIDSHGTREVRRLIVGDYELQYELTEETLYIARIWHGREQR